MNQMLKLASSILYWKYSREEESYERNLKIYNIYNSLGISNIIVCIILFFLILGIGSKFSDSASVLDSAFMISLMFGFIHYLLQKLHALEVYIKVKQALGDASAKQE
ncbi:hypothetical protein R4Z09_21405 [Niallia oryzisoli]|uniref:Uncharacterized protein n=1 Tax=Niallia oryzisoli TaxID=1737571 RepID=A0ABZ2CC12_9BACI